MPRRSNHKKQILVYLGLATGPNGLLACSATHMLWHVMEQHDQCQALADPNPPKWWVNPRSRKRAANSLRSRHDYACATPVHRHMHKHDSRPSPPAQKLKEPLEGDLKFFGKKPPQWFKKLLSCWGGFCILHIFFPQAYKYRINHWYPLSKCHF